MVVNIINIKSIFAYVASCQLNHSLDSNVYSQGCVQHPSPLQIARDSDHKIGNCLGPVLYRIWLLLFSPANVKTCHPPIWRGCRTSRAAKWRCSMYAHLKMVKGIGTAEHFIKTAAKRTRKVQLQLMMSIRTYLK